MCETWEPMAAGGGYLRRSVWILWMCSSVSSRSTASVSELSRSVTHTAVSSPQCKESEKRPLSNSVAFRTLFKRHRYLKNSYHKKNKPWYSVLTGILPSTSKIF